MHRAESVLQNCVMGRCAICIFIYCYRSHLCLTLGYWRGQLWIQIQLQIHPPSVHWDAVTISQKTIQCTWCGYNHPQGNCPAANKEHYNCHGIGHYTVLCRCPRSLRNPGTGTGKACPTREGPVVRQSSCSPRRSSQPCQKSNWYSPYTTCNHTHHRHKKPTLSHQVSHITTINTQSSQEWILLTDVALDGHTSFHTTLKMITKHGSKPIPVKVYHSADLNIIPVSKYRKLFPAHFTKAGNLKQKALYPTKHTWPAYNNTPQQLLGFYIANIHHKTHPEVLQVRYVFKDTTFPKISLLCAKSERLDIVKFQVPNETPSTAADTITSSSKHISFRTPIQTYRPVKTSNGKHWKLPLGNTHYRTIAATPPHHRTIHHTLYDHFRTIHPQTLITRPSGVKCSLFTRPSHHSWCP